MAGQTLGNLPAAGSGLIASAGAYAPDAGVPVKVLYQRVTIADNTIQTSLTPTLPAKTKIVWANLFNVSAVAVDGSDATGTADTYALFNIGTSTAYATNTVSNATASVVASASTSLLASNDVTRVSGFQTAAPFVNTGSAVNYFVLAPLSTTGNRINPGTGTTAATDGYKFNGAATVDVTIYYMEFADQYATVAA